MATHRTLVFGDDGSPPADTAWLWINNHGWPGWRVVAVTARMPALGPPVDRQLARPHRWDPPTPRAPVPGSGIVEVEHLTCVMDPRLALADFEPTPDLVVVGPTGRGVLKALHLGSTADWLLQDPSAPLVIARSPRRADHILVCADGSEHAQRAAEVLARLPLVSGAAVTVLGVDDGRADPASGIARAVPVLEDTGAKVTTVEVRGKPTRTILDQIDEHDVGLAVLGTRGHTTIRRLLVGSTASGIARSAPCSILTVTAPPPG